MHEIETRRFAVDLHVQTKKTCRHAFWYKHLKMLSIIHFELFCQGFRYSLARVNIRSTLYYNGFCDFTFILVIIVTVWYLVYVYTHTRSDKLCILIAFKIELDMYADFCLRCLFFSILYYVSSGHLLKEINIQMFSVSQGYRVSYNFVKNRCWCVIRTFSLNHLNIRSQILNFLYWLLLSNISNIIFL